MATNFDAGSILAQVPIVGGGLLSLATAQWDTDAADTELVTQGTAMGPLGVPAGSDGIINGLTGNLDYANTIVIASALGVPGAGGFHANGAAGQACSWTTESNAIGSVNSCSFRNLTDGTVNEALDVQLNATAIFILKN